MTILDSIDSTLYPSPIDLVFKALWCYIPEPLLHYVRYLPFHEYRRFRTFLDFTDSFSRGIVSQSKEKSDGKDMMSVLLRANASENPNDKMTDNEVISQITCVITLSLTKVVACSQLPHIQYAAPCRTRDHCKLLNLVPLGGCKTSRVSETYPGGGRRFP
jgi:hypothetical protein